MRLIFMGTPDFACTILQALSAAKHEIVTIYTQPPRRAGRGQKTQSGSVQKWAENNGFYVQTPHQIGAESEQHRFQEYQADLAIIAAYGLLLPPALLQVPRYGCVNIHASLLPRWRGAAPIQRALLAGDSETGITLMQMASGLDTGAILSRATIPIRHDETAGSLHDKLAELGAESLIKFLSSTPSTWHITPQPERGITYARKIKKSESQINWQNTADIIDRHVRAFNPRPGAWFNVSDVGRIRVLTGASLTLPSQNLPSGKILPGTLLDTEFTIACGLDTDGTQQAYRPIKIQPPGGVIMNSAAFLRGHSLPIGTIFSMHTL